MGVFLLIVFICLWLFAVWWVGFAFVCFDLGGLGWVLGLGGLLDADFVVFGFDFALGGFGFGLFVWLDFGWVDWWVSWGFVC